MAQDQIEQLFHQLIQPDTEKVKQATAALAKICSSSPEVLLVLVQILTSPDKPDNIRQFAAVEARKRVSKLWPMIDKNTKPGIRSSILQFAISDSHKSLRHAAAQIIAEIAIIDLANGQWTELPGQLLEAANSPDPLHREMGLYIMLSLIEGSPELFLNDISQVVHVLHDKIKDPQSPDVRLNSLAMFAAISPLLDHSEQSEEIHAIQACIPSMVEVLDNAITSGEEEVSIKAFEYFQEILENSPVVFGKAFADLLRFMLQIVANKDFDADIRLQAVNFLAEAVALKKLKIQSLRMGEEIALKALQVVVEIDDFDDDDDDDDDAGQRNPATQCLALLDMLASSLPPVQVVLPVLKAVGTYSSNADPNVRRAGILGLSMMVEGAPDFFATQLKEIAPLILKLLADTETIVRRAALKAVSRLAEDLSDEFAVLHETILPSIINNFDLAVKQYPNISGKAREDSKRIIFECCIAIDSMMDGMSKDATAKYIDELMPRFNLLLKQEDHKMKMVALSAIGAVAESAMDGFLPYFQEAMRELGLYMTGKADQPAIDLRRACTEALGKVALAVGPDAFKEFVHPLMTASEEALYLESTDLKEQSYILWSQLAKVYKDDFAPFLDGVVKGLLNCLSQEETAVMSDEAEATLAKVLAAMGDKSDGISDAQVNLKIDRILEESGDTGDLEDVEIDDFDDLDDGPVSAIALEKEIALEVLGDVLSHSNIKFLAYFPDVIKAVLSLTDHPYSGIISSAISTLWRAYGTLWKIETDKGMAKWQPGIPVQIRPSKDLEQLSDMVMKATLENWVDQEDRDAVTDINRMLSETLSLCGPAPIAGENVLAKICQVLIQIITKQHSCQTDAFEEGFGELDTEESSEYDWLVVETALDVLVALAKAVGQDFAEIWKMFEKPVVRHISANDSNERAAATGTLAECILAMGNRVTPYTKSLLKIASHRLTDEDAVTKGNAIYAAGLLCLLSEDKVYIIKEYNSILGKLEPLLQDNTEGHLLDNAAGCVARMIIAHPDRVPLQEVLPRLIELAPAKEDWEVNGPIFQCFSKLYQAGNPVIQQYTAHVVSAIQKVLGEPEEHLDDKTRALVNELASYLRDKA